MEWYNLSMGRKKIYNPKQIEARWSKRWDETGLYEVDIKEAKKPFYNLMMFPYPSAEGLHVGNMYAFTGADIYGRYQRMMGFDVFEPIGLDGFGIHSENYAIKIGKHPAEQAKVSEANFYRQLKMIGNGFAWKHRLETYDPEYYRLTQWLFIQMFRHGLAYKKESWVNWCPSCKTVVSDEQVEGGVCERCKTEVVRKEVSSWHFKITEYAEKLLANIEKIDWPEKIKTAQRQWIGKKEGVRVAFEVKGGEPVEKLEVFTTRLDTIGGVSFLVVGPEKVKEWMEAGWQVSNEVGEYVEKALNMTEQARKLVKEKTGVEMNLVVVNPVTGEEIKVFVADYVVGEVGTGVVMGVPAHDERDWDFAKKYGLEIKQVVKGKQGSEEEAMVDDGVLVNSGKYDGLSSQQAREDMLKDLEDKGMAKKQTNYHLRDWVISRQRYWGPPIPMVKCDKCGWQPVDESELPVVLPDLDDYQPKGDGTAPLANASSGWLVTKCPVCGGKATREVDVSDTFLDSSWYFLAYPQMIEGEWKGGEFNKGQPFDVEVMKRWLPVNACIGGAEHAVLHLLYARFVTQVLNDWGLVDFEEPFPFLFSHGLIIKDGAKMSKSRGNVVNPDEYIERYGADALRAYLMFLGPYNQGGDFRDSGMAGMYRWLERVFWLFEDEQKLGGKTSLKLNKKLNQVIKKVGEDLGKFSYNTAIAALMELINVWREEGEVMSVEDGRRMVQIMAPIVPYVTEEWWEKLGGEGSVHASGWPEYEEIVEERVMMVVQVNGRVRATVEMGRDEAEEQDKVVELVMGDERVGKWVESKPKRIVFVPGKLINLVV